MEKEKLDEAIYEILSRHSEQKDIDDSGTCEWVFTDEDFFETKMELLALMLKHK